MLERPEYLAWAMRHYGRVRYNLASSGVPSLSEAETGSWAMSRRARSEAWDRLRKAVARYNGVASAQCVGCLGASHGIWLAYAAMLDRGQEVLVENPTYEPLIGAARAAGAVVRQFDRGPWCGYRLDPERVFAALTPRTKAVAISSLHNPSGVRASDEAMRSIARRMDAQGGFLFVDEVYAPFDNLVDNFGVFEGTARRLYPNVVTTGSLSKAYGLGPLRVGWVLGPEGVIERATDALIASVGELPLVWMEEAISALEQIPTLAKRTRELLGSKRSQVSKWIAERASLKWSNPLEGLFGLVVVQGNGDVRPAIERGIERYDVIVAPGSFFGIPNAFRLAWSLPENLLDSALDRLDCVLQEARLI